MCYSFGLSYHLSNFSKLFKWPLANDLDDALFEHYHNYLYHNSLFEHAISWRTTKIIDLSQLSTIASGYHSKLKPYMSKNTDHINKCLNSGYFDRLMLNLRQDDFEIYQLATLIIKVIIIQKLDQYTEGTTNESLGISHIDFRECYDEYDFYELVLHQLVHILTFIDDRTTPQLDDSLKNTLIQTPFTHKAGGNQFSLYIIFHAFLVGVEILLYRKSKNRADIKGNYHGTTESLLKKSLKSSAILQEYLPLFTPHGQRIIHIITNKLMQNYLIAEDAT